MGGAVGMGKLVIVKIGTCFMGRIENKKTCPCYHHQQKDVLCGTKQSTSRRFSVGEKLLEITCVLMGKRTIKGDFLL